MSKYKFNNGFIYCNDFKLPMTRVVEALNEMSAKLHEKDREYKDLFEAFEDGQKVLRAANKRVENLSRVNNEYGEVLTPIWDYCRGNVKVELGKSMTEALIESHKLLQSQVWSLEQRCKLLEEDAEDTAKYVEIQRGELAKANERVKECHEELVNRHNHIQELRQESGEYAMLIANLVRRADVKTDLLQNPTFEKASEQLNKFAIEKKVEGYYDSCIESGMNGGQADLLSDIYGEQLRKEQASEYEFREIGETEWTPCDKDWFDYCQKSPEHEARLRKEQDDEKTKS
ncbi:hypothetical protein KUL113_04220 [Tenacibaculum sp. KUL113]|nr:hypothetical protein KUL113_04220 [Tenacibaculum sp. KUL113]